MVTREDGRMDNLGPGGGSLWRRMENYTYGMAISMDRYPLILFRVKGSPKRLFVLDTESGLLHHLGDGSSEDQPTILENERWGRDTEFFVFRREISKISLRMQPIGHPLLT